MTQHSSSFNRLYTPALFPCIPQNNTCNTSHHLYQTTPQQQQTNKQQQQNQTTQHVQSGCVVPRPPTRDESYRRGTRTRTRKTIWLCIKRPTYLAHLRRDGDDGVLVDEGQVFIHGDNHVLRLHRLGRGSSRDHLGFVDSSP